MDNIRISSKKSSLGNCIYKGKSLFQTVSWLLLTTIYMYAIYKETGSCESTFTDFKEAGV